MEIYCDRIMNVPEKVATSEKQQVNQSWSALVNASFTPWIAPLLNSPVDIVTKGSYWYPILGIYHFIIHPWYWTYMLATICPFCMLSSSIFMTLYITIFPILLANAVIQLGPLGAIIAHIQLALQCNALALAISNYCINPWALKYLFECVLIENGENGLVLRAKLKGAPGKTTMFHEWFPIAIAVCRVVRMIFLALISLVPIIGPALSVLINSPRRGKGAHYRYMSMKYSTLYEREFYLQERWGEYAAFGLIGGLLEMIPVLSGVFVFTNTVGAALWAVEIEQSKSKDACKSEDVHEIKEVA